MKRMNVLAALLGSLSTLLLLATVRPLSATPTTRDAQFTPAQIQRQVHPGDTFQLSMQIANTSTAGEVDGYSITVIDFPLDVPRWGLAITPQSVSQVQAGESRTIIVTITIPPEAPVGLYAFGIRASSTGGIIRTSNVQVEIQTPTLNCKTYSPTLLKE